MYKTASILKQHDAYLEGKPGYTKYTKHGADVFVNTEKLIAIAFTTKAQNPLWHYNFNSIDQMKKYITSFFANMKSHEESKAVRKAERCKPHSLKVGDILYSSWGYDQTNIDFYQVIEVNSPTMVTIRGINDVATQDGYMQGTRTPCKDQFHGEPMRKKASPDNSIKLNSHTYASLWDGKPKRYTAYA